MPPPEQPELSITSLPDISIFLPVYNEELNLLPLHARIDAALAKLNRTTEIIYIDDGSTDDSLAVLRSLAKQDSRVRVVVFKRNFGQTAAMSAGFDAARGKVILPMDSDGQNDPEDIKLLLDKIDAGYDVVSGWRKDRKDKVVTRRIPSILANRLISFLGGVPLHDYGCSLKAYRREAMTNVRLYGETHRFIPIFAAWEGARVTEIVVRHHPRMAGVSKYGLSRTFKVVLDLINIKFMRAHKGKPMWLFGFGGIICFIAAALAALAAALNSLSSDNHPTTMMLAVIALVAVVFGVHLISLGFVAEMMTRNYLSLRPTPLYSVREEETDGGVEGATTVNR